MAPQRKNEDMEMNKKIDRILKTVEEIDRILKTVEENKETVTKNNEGITELRSTVKELKVCVEQHQVAIGELVAEAKHMKDENEEKDKKIGALEMKAESMEQVLRMNDVILSGLKITPRSYAAALGNEGDEEEPERRSVEDQIAEFLKNKGIDFDVSNIEACYSLSRKANTEKPAVLLKFVNRRDKIALLRQGRKLKGSDVYINEHLTKKNAEIAKKARIARKAGKVQRTWTNARSSSS